MRCHALVFVFCSTCSNVFWIAYHFSIVIDVICACWHVFIRLMCLNYCWMLHWYAWQRLIVWYVFGVFSDVWCFRIVSDSWYTLTRFGMRWYGLIVFDTFYMCSEFWHLLNCVIAFVTVCVLVHILFVSIVLVCFETLDTCFWYGMSLAAMFVVSDACFILLDMFWSCVIVLYSLGISDMLWYGLVWLLIFCDAWDAWFF